MQNDPKWFQTRIAYIKQRLLKYDQIIVLALLHGRIIFFIQVYFNELFLNMHIVFFS